jgi:hypothetical protein
MRTKRLVDGLNNLQNILVYVDGVTFKTTIKEAFSDTFFKDSKLRSDVKCHLIQYVSYYRPHVTDKYREVLTYFHKKYNYQIGIQLI